jgi:hypothetical protein
MTEDRLQNVLTFYQRRKKRPVLIENLMINISVNSDLISELKDFVFLTLLTRIDDKIETKQFEK